VFGQDHYNPTPEDLFYHQQYQAYPNTPHQEQIFSNQNAFFQQQDFQQDFDFDLLLLSSDTPNNFKQLHFSEFTEPTPQIVSNNCQPSGYFNPPCDCTQPTELDQLDQFLNFNGPYVDPTPSFQTHQAYQQQFGTDQFLLHIPTNHESKPTDQFVLNIETDIADEPTQVLVTIPAVENPDRKSKTFPQETNKEKCQKYREKKKQEKKMLDDELDLEMEKNRALRRKADILEERVDKFKKIHKKIAMKQKVNMSAEIFHCIFDS